MLGVFVFIEICLHLFKYRYYKPDVVIIHTGGNDSWARTTQNYQPDYSHWKKQLHVPQPFTAVGRYMLKSYLFSVVMLPVMYGTAPDRMSIKIYGDAPVRWFKETSFEDTAIGFRSNLETLIREIRADGGHVFLAPFRMAPKNDFSQSFKEAVLDNERILKELSQQFDVNFIPFPASVISHKNWVNRSHVNAKGSYEKARHFAKYIEKLDWRAVLAHQSNPK